MARNWEEMLSNPIEGETYKQEKKLVIAKDCNCDNLDQDVEGYTCYKCYERGA